MRSHTCLVLCMQTYPWRLNQARGWFFKSKGGKSLAVDMASLGSLILDISLSLILLCSFGPQLPVSYHPGVLGLAGLPDGLCREKRSSRAGREIYVSFPQWGHTQDLKRKKSLSSTHTWKPIFFLDSQRCTDHLNQSGFPQLVPVHLLHNVGGHKHPSVNNASQLSLAKDWTRLLSYLHSCLSAPSLSSYFQLFLEPWPFSWAGQTLLGHLISGG